MVAECLWQFVAHRDVYGPIDRCGGYRSRDVQWNGGFNQAILKSGVYDPDMQNDDLCRVGGNGATTSYANDGHCDDPTGLGGLVTKAQCDLGTDMTDCGVHENLVVFGYGNPKVVYDEQGVPKDFAATFCYGKDGSIHTGREYSTVECSDGASYIDSGAPATCYYGTDPACPMRRFAFLPEDAGPEEADDSCATSGDGQCDDGLLYSQYAPGQNTCAPNTDMTDCGWRMGKRTHRVGKAVSDTCKEHCIELNPVSTASIDGGPCEQRCLDNSGFVFRFDREGYDPKSDHSRSTENCGRGTDFTHCSDLPDAGELYVLPPRYENEVCTPKTNMHRSDDVYDVCTDGGEGSFRVKFLTPLQFLPYYEFACRYGTQVLLPKIIPKTPQCPQQFHAPRAGRHLSRPRHERAARHSRRARAAVRPAVFKLPRPRRRGL